MSFGDDDEDSDGAPVQYPIQGWAAHDHQDDANRFWRSSVIG